VGFLRKASRAIGNVDKGLIERGLLARGRVVECRRTSMSTGTQVHSVVCELTVDVELEDRPVYAARCKHPIPMPYLAQFESGQGFVAVRVDPGDPQNIELDLAHDVPVSRAGGAVPDGPGGAASTVQVVDASQGLPDDVARDLAAAGINLDGSGASLEPQTHASALSAAEILATGTPCRAVVQSAQPLDMQKDGLDVWGIVLNAIADGEPASQARIGVGVPPEAMALVFPGANLPAKRRSDIADGVSIDWDAAVAERR
jgi:hypothetical protein